MTTPAPKDTRKPVIIAVVFDGKEPFRIEDLPLEVVDRIAREHEYSWVTVLTRPMDTLRLAHAIVAAVAEHTGQPAPDSTLSVAALAKMFVPVPDDVGDPDYALDAKSDDDVDPFTSSGNET